MNVVDMVTGPCISWLSLSIW